MRLPIRWLLLVGLVALVAYLFAWPVPIDPVAWSPPPAPALAGLYAVNNRLAGAEALGKGAGVGPEGTAIDAQGRVYTGYQDGRIVRIAVDGKTVEPVANTGGRPLGMALDAAGNLVVCDPVKGLLSVTPSGAITVLATEHGGVPFKFTDDVDVAPDGTIYFSDATSRWGVHHFREDALEHRPNGRLLAFHPATRKTELLLGDLYFANGVALNGDRSFVLVNETWAYRVRRVWLAGPKKGTAEVFLDNLPGFPDNVTYSVERRVFWLALFAPRDDALDAMAQHPWSRRLVFRLPGFLQPAPARHGFVLGVDEQGQVVHNLQDPSPSSFAPVTSAREHAGYLYLGSLWRDAVGRVRVP